MDTFPVTLKESLRPTAFDCQPTPIIILSKSSDIVLTNRAAQQLFEQPTSLIESHVTTLPIRWQDGTEDALHQLLTNASADDRNDEELGIVRLQIQICRQPTSSVTARLSVTCFDLEGEPYRMLSFENVKESATVAFLPPSRQATPISRPSLRQKSKTDTYSGAVTADPSDKSQLEQQFSRLVDAIYHNDERNGFLLSADETFCYPNYRAAQAVAPVEIDDLNLFFENWDVWDAHFQHKEPISEYPSVWLNRHRQKFHRRYGLKENGKKVVLDTSGDPLYDSQTGEYLGGVVWISPLGEYDEVIAMDLKSTLGDFRNICDRLPHLLWTVNAHGQADYFSESWYDFTGLSEEQSLGSGFMSAIDETHMKEIWNDFHDATITKKEVNREAKYRRHDGEWIWMNVRAKPLVDGSGNILKWYGSSTDVDSLVIDRLCAEHKKDQMMDMLSNNEIGLFEVLPKLDLTVLEGRLEWLGDNKFYDFLGANEKDSSGVATLAKYMRATINSEVDNTVFEVLIGARWYKFRLISDGAYEELQKVLGCCVDVTELRERANLAAENARLHGEATLEMEKSRLKTAFLAHMSHEIRTPIAGIVGIADMLSESRLDDEQTECIGNIQHSANNLLTIVNDILDLSKIEAGQLQYEKIRFDVYDIVRQVEKLFLANARGKCLDLICNIDKSIGLEAEGDPGRVRQVVTNLVSNAIKFTASGSVEMLVNTKGSKFQIVVQDTGQGIDQETMTQLFKPFVQGDASTARRHGGTGLGLTISRDLAQGMGGTLVLNSAPFKGTKAVLTLPREGVFTSVPVKERSHSRESDYLSRQTPTLTARFKSTNGSTKQPSTPKEPNVATQPLVLIVEDNAINQKVALNLVRKLGYATQAAWNGQEALDYLVGCAPSSSPNDSSDQSPSSTTPDTAPIPMQPAMILMDCQMPLLDGYEATKRLRTDGKYRSFRSVPVVALTASAIQGDKEKCQAAGMDDYLSKPVNRALLQEMLEKWIPKEKVS